MIKEPKIIIWDLEIIPDLSQALKYWIKLCPPWGGSQTLKPDVSSICTFGYKILGENKARVKNVWDFPGWEKNVNDDKELCKFIYDTLLTADAWVYHNGDWFDKRHLLTRLFKYRLPSLPKVPTIDTKKVAKANLLSLSNSLAHLTKEFTDERKMDHGEGWDLWIDTHGRKKKAMNLMAKYCKQDVTATESLFKRLRPFIHNLPNHNLFEQGQQLCHNCGSTRLRSHGWSYTKTSQYRRFRCRDCESISKKPNEKAILRSV
jgi:hypothetical protein